MFRSLVALVRSRLSLFAAVSLTLGLASAGAQQTVVLPSTISTYAGSVPAPAAVGIGKLCNGGGMPATGNTLPVATDSVNDGCPAAQAIFSADNRGGVATDPQGNVYVLDGGNGGNNILRKIDARSGLISLIVGGTVTACSNAVDKTGDGCSFVQAGNFNNPRGMESDPYGNIVIAGYGDLVVHLLCNALSPTCSAAQLGTMRLAAGCVTTSANYGASGNGADNVPATSTGTCSTANAELNQPRGASIDAYGNIFIADTGNQRFRLVLGPQTYNGVTNPMWAILQLNPAYATLNAGYIYSILAKPATSTITAGAFCSGTSGPKYLDTYGDGCAFFKAQVATTSGSLQATAQDAAGDLFLYDYSTTDLVRVVYAGGAQAAAAITANNPTVTTPVVGSVYIIAGGGSTGPSAAPLPGNLANFSGQIYKMTIDPNTQNLFYSYAANIVFDDLSTGYVRKIGSGGTNCASTGSATGATPDTQGDGCTALAASFGGSNGLGIAFDHLGNLFFADTTNVLIRKVAAGSYGPVAVKTTFTPNYNIHSSNTNGPTAVTLGANSDFTLTAGTCMQNTTTDNTYDCPNTVNFVPSAIGLRSAPTTITSTSTATTPVVLTTTGSVTGNSTGTALVFDTQTPLTSQVGTQTAVTATALNGANNLFTANATSVVKMPLGGTAVSIYTPASAPKQIAADPQGNVYLASGTTANVVKLTFTAPSTYTAASLSSVAATNTAFGTVQGIAADANGNVYLANSAGSVVRYTQSTGQVVTLTATSLSTVTGSNVTGLALDNLGNLLIADNGAGIVYRLPVNGIASGLPATVVSGVKPYTVAADAAGDTYYVDSTAKTVVMVPVTGSATTVLTGLSVPDGLALDGLGNVYVADTSLAGLEKVSRNAFTYTFANTSATLAGTITNVGNTTATGYNATGLDPAEFPVTSVSPANCFSSTAITPGLACSVTVQFSPSASGTGTVSSTLAFTPAATEFGSVVLSGVKTGQSVTTNTTIGAASPGAPVYSTAGIEVTFPITVTASDGSTPSGSISVQVDGGTPVAYTLAGGTVMVPLSGLAAGNHTIQAVYANQGGLVGSTSTSVMFTIAQATTTVTWNPGTNSQQYSAAIGAGVLDATAVVTGTTTTVPGFFLYSATPSGGSPQTVHSASFLPIGTYGLTATFVPADATDFSGNSASVASYTVTKASTTAALGATQTLVAADGSGNFTSIQAAINTIGATAGGSVYVKPGTYTGDVTVVQPNVSLRGLGGDPTQVILTHSGGAFGGSGVYQYAGEFNASQANGAQLPAGSSLFNGDQGSATLVVAKGINSSVSTATLIPNGFYGENFTLLNTYDTDTTTTTTTYLPAANSGTCTANQGPARTYNDLYNNSLECASQALAIFTTSDLSVMNNIYTGSLQDTIYAGSQGSGSNGFVPARQYWFRGKVQGQVDYIFGDAAAVFDFSTIYTLPKLTSISGTDTIEAQNKANQTGSGSDYLSGYVMNSNVFTSYTTGMTGLEFGRPYGKYSTYVMLNSYVDQVNPGGYIEFSGQTNLPTSTYGEFNNLLYTDPATGAADLNGVLYTGQGSNTGTGVSGTRETTSMDPGTPEAANAVKTSLTAAQATLYYPANFLGTAVPATLSSVANFNPNATLAAKVNGFTSGGTVTSIVGGTSVTILMRPQTPGLGAITNGTYTIPTGTYNLVDTYNGTATTVASGTLDASGEAYFTGSTLNAGAHSFVWTYSGDANFSGSTASAYALQVSGAGTTTTLTATTNLITYGQAAQITAMVAASTGTATGTVTLTIDGGTTQTGTLVGGQYTFAVAGLQAGVHSFTAAYAGSTGYVPSATASSLPFTVNQAVLAVTAACANHAYGAQNNCSASVAGYQFSDTAASVFTGTPAGTTTAMPNSPAGTYTATPANLGLTSFGSTNYTVSPVNTTFTVTGSGNAAQVILFRALPNFPAGNYQLSARTTSGLPIAYTVTGNATVSGSTLTVLAGGGTVTVTASTPADPNGDYATATPVQRSFTAQ